MDHHRAVIAKTEADSLQGLANLSGYEHLPSTVPVVYAPSMRGRTEDLDYLLTVGSEQLSQVFESDIPELEAMLAVDEDWKRAPREKEQAYPLKLSYFTQSVRLLALVLPDKLSAAIRPCTALIPPGVLDA